MTVTSSNLLKFQLWMQGAQFRSSFKLASVKFTDWGKPGHFQHACYHIRVTVNVFETSIVQWRWVLGQLPRSKRFKTRGKTSGKSINGKMRKWWESWCSYTLTQCKKCIHVQTLRFYTFVGILFTFFQKLHQSGLHRTIKQSLALFNLKKVTCT